MTTLSRRKAILFGGTLLAASVGAVQAEEPKNTTTKDMPIRRNEFALTLDECHEVLKRVDHAVLATADAEDYPYACPVTPFFLNGKIYFHGMAATKGRRAANIRQNPKASLAYIAYARTNERKQNVDYVSVIAEGPVRAITDPEEKVNLMRRLMQRHTPSEDVEKALATRRKGIETQMDFYEVTIERLTGKCRNESYEAFFGRKRVQPK